MLAMTPPMGWNTWNTFGMEINEKLVLEMVDTFVEKGYKDAGYEYVVIDDSWSLKSRDENGNLVANPEKFPHGMKYIADYVHAKGLKFGMYSCAGALTCCAHPASYGHEYQDARLFASFGIDLLKYDFCFFPPNGNNQNAYLTMAMALRASGRDILFSACNWGSGEPWNWMRSVGANMYRSTPDIVDSFASTADIINRQMDKLNANAPGCFNDLDMLTVGMSGKGLVGRENGNNALEYTTQFAFWCLAGAPLMMGCDLRAVDEEYRKLLQNRDLIAINQDPDCRPLYNVTTDFSFCTNHYCFMRQLADGSFAVGMFNLSEDAWDITAVFTAMGIPSNAGMTVSVKNVLTGADEGDFKEYLIAHVEPHGCRMFRCTPRYTGK